MVRDCARRPRAIRDFGARHGPRDVARVPRVSPAQGAAHLADVAGAERHSVHAHGSAPRRVRRHLPRFLPQRFQHGIQLRRELQLCDGGVGGVRRVRGFVRVRPGQRQARHVHL